MKCKISAWGCIYHACMSDDCQKEIVLSQGTDWRKGKCDKKTQIKPWKGVVKSDNNMVRAKFKVDERTETVSGGKVSLSPVTGGSEENSKFFKWTPYGKLEMGTINEEAIKEFVPGKEFYIDFTPVEKEVV